MVVLAMATIAVLVGSQSFQCASRVEFHIPSGNTRRICKSCAALGAPRRRREAVKQASQLVHAIPSSASPKPLPFMLAPSSTSYHISLSNTVTSDSRAFLQLGVLIVDCARDCIGGARVRRPGTRPACCLVPCNLETYYAYQVSPSCKLWNR